MSNRWLMVMVVAFAAQLSAAQGDTTAYRDTTAPRTVLIVKGDSYMENAVTKILKDSLGRQGVTVETARIKKLSSKNSADYTAIIVFSAIKASGQLDPVVRRYMETKGNDPTSNIMVCTVIGEKWSGAAEKEDAVSAATKTLNPVVVAAKIMSYLTKGNTQGGSGY